MAVNLNIGTAVRSRHGLPTELRTVNESLQFILAVGCKARQVHWLVILIHVLSLGCPACSLHLAAPGAASHRLLAVRHPAGRRHQHHWLKLPFSNLYTVKIRPLLPEGRPSGSPARRGSAGQHLCTAREASAGGRKASLAICCKSTAMRNQEVQTK